MTQQPDADVLIVGAGPVGLVAALDLASRGVSVIVVEQRAYLEPPNVKCNHVASRTMESLRRLGIAAEVRAAGLPSDYPQDVAFRTALTGREFARIAIPASGQRYTSHTGPDTSWNTPEPPHRINQTFLEPILARHAAAAPGVMLLNETLFHSLAQDDDGVSIVVSDLDGGDERALRGRYLIGADGGRSNVRKQIGAKLSGDPVLQHVQSTCIRSADLYDRMSADEPRAWGYYTFNARRLGHVYAIDGRETFLVHTYLSPDEAATPGSVDRDAAIRAILGVSDDFAYEAVSKEDWIARRLLADRFRDGRVFLAGDATHLWVPFAGFGMNAGIADVLNLTWALGAHLDGWADEHILDAYEAERRPITEQVSHFAMNHQQKLAKPSLPAHLEEDSAEGEAARAAFGAAVHALNEPQFAAAGLNYGYVYDASPVIAYDDEPAPGYTMGEYTPSTVPGCRAPHFRLADGTSFYDLLSPGYTLVARPGSEPAELASEAELRGIPLSVVEADDDVLPAEYRFPLTLVRQDQQVVWRGEQADAATAAELWELLRGARVAAAV
ncbi:MULTISPECIES: FAD-dependent oxidoreductase [unclassified Microbacterium]|uniref:FAD-dependent oxidoreductase n=1 Tax=unclassified Microbacterium TaxID=2609290 RepID=UPI0012F8BDAE|nr:FAD-dependent oxidoreductase [Microbacterium sp. MAH-37]MVQ43395.1 FAD-binding protein [Microbacterium sp. MAH-37]